MLTHKQYMVKKEKKTKDRKVKRARHLVDQRAYENRMLVARIKK